MYRIASPSKLVLASTSPRRKELLAACGLEFDIIPPDCDESVAVGELAEGLVGRLALEKALSVADKNQDAWVVGADTVVVVDGKILGKPESKDDAKRMLREIRGRWHEVWGGIAVVREASQHQTVAAYRSQVQVVPLSDVEIESYVASGEPMDKAGSYAIQGIGSGIVAQVEGSYTNVVGLNLAELLQILKENGIIAIR